MTVRGRLTLIYSAAMILTVAVGAALVWWQVGVALRSSLDQALDTRATAAAAALENDGQSGLQESDGPAAGIFVAMFAGNRLVDSTAGTPAGLQAPAATGVGGSIVLGGVTYATRVARADGSFQVIAGASLAGVHGAQGEVARSLVLVGILSIILSLAGGWWLAGRAMRPVALITAEARLIGAADLARRVPVPNQRDELWALATTVNGMLDRVEAASQRQRAFVAAASHDLRTPIAAMQAELELANDPRSSREDMTAAIRAAHADTVRLGDLATALLDMAAVDLDGRAVVRTVVQIDDLVQSVLRKVASVAEARGVTLAATESDGAVRIDRIRLEQALTNLALNAVVHGPAGGTVEINAHLESSDPPAAGTGTILAIEVLDRGPGIAPELASRLFEPFVRGRRTPVPGFGLGLATAAAGIRAHHGSIGYEPRLDGGSCFWIRVPG